MSKPTPTPPKCWCGRPSVSFIPKAGDQIGLCIDCATIINDPAYWLERFGAERAA